MCLSTRLPAIFERLRNILHESAIDKRVQYMIEVMFAIRKDGFKDHPVIQDGLDLVDEEDQFTHMLPLEDEYDPEDLLSESRHQGAALGGGASFLTLFDNLLVCFFSPQNQTSSRWIPTSWRTKKSTKPSKEVSTKLSAGFQYSQIVPPSD